MTANSEVYAKAAQRLNDGWTQKTFTDEQGNVCFIQSVLTSASLPGAYLLPRDMLKEIDASMEKHWDYRLMRHFYRYVTPPGPTTTVEAIQQAVILWNDVWYRRKSTVVKSMHAVSKDAEFSCLPAEHVRLTQEVEALRAQIAELQRKAEQFQDENNKLRRLTNSFALRSDRRELAKLEASLALTWSELETLPVAQSYKESNVCKCIRGQT